MAGRPSARAVRGERGRDRLCGARRRPCRLGVARPNRPFPSRHTPSRHTPSVSATLRYPGAAGPARPRRVGHDLARQARAGQSATRGACVHRHHHARRSRPATSLSSQAAAGRLRDGADAIAWPSSPAPMPTMPLRSMRWAGRPRWRAAARRRPAAAAQSVPHVCRHRCRLRVRRGAQRQGGRRRRGPLRAPARPICCTPASRAPAS